MQRISESLLLAIDIGGTKTALAIASPTSQSIDFYLERHQFATPATGKRAVAALLAAARELVGDRAVAGIGVSFGGQVSTDQRPSVKSLVIPGWEHLDLRTELAQALGGAPTLIANDGEAAARGEYLTIPVEQRPETLAYLTVSTGVGGAFLVSGRPHRGHHGLAAEVGHIPVRSDGRCPCGGTGHLETFASGPAIARAAAAALVEKPHEDSRLRVAHAAGRSLTAQDVDRAARQGDALAAAILAEAGTLVGRAVALISLLFDPDAVIIGGGVAQAGNAFWAALLRAARFEALHDTIVQPARLGTDSALRGALELARDAAKTSNALSDGRRSHELDAISATQS